MILFVRIFVFLKMLLFWVVLDMDILLDIFSFFLKGEIFLGMILFFFSFSGLVGIWFLGFVFLGMWLFRGIWMREGEERYI